MKRVEGFAEVAIVPVRGDGEIRFVVEVHAVVIGDHQRLHAFERAEMRHDDLELTRRSVGDLEPASERR